MSSNEIRISLIDIDKDKIPEALIEYYKDGNLQYATYVAAIVKNGPYTTVKSKADANNDGKIDHKDDAIFLQLAKSAAQLLKH